MAMTQESRLGDVAGSVTLDPSALTQGGDDIEDPKAARRADRQLLGEVLTDCYTEAERLGGLVTEARQTVMYRDQEDVLSPRLMEASADLGLAAQEVYKLRLTPSLKEILYSAEEAMIPCEGAALNVREELDRGGVAFTRALQLVGECKSRLNETLVLLEGGGAGTTAATEQGAPDGSLDGQGGDVERTPDEIIEAFCERARAQGQAVVDACLAAQFRGLAAIESRSAAREMIDEAAFSGVRQICISEHPEDHVRRDLCEQEKLTALRLDRDTGTP
jgi:hypothetical protein